MVPNGTCGKTGSEVSIAWLSYSGPLVVEEMVESRNKEVGGVPSPKEVRR